MTDTWENIKGQKDELVGKAKEVIGKTTNDSQLQAEGIAQQVEGAARAQTATGKKSEAALKRDGNEKANRAESTIKENIATTHEIVQDEADERLSEAISEGKRLKEEAATQAEELRQDAIKQNEAEKEQDREQAVEANKYHDEIEQRAKQVIDDVLDRREEQENNN